MELLAKLLGGQERVKIMRYFLHHEDVVIDAHTLSEKTKSKTIVVRKELTALSSAGFIEKRKSRISIELLSGKKVQAKNKEVIGYGLNALFPHNQALKDLLFDFELLDKRDLADRFKAIGRIKLFIVAGVFLAEEKSRVDILIVGEVIKKPKAERVFETLSSELGREVIYSIMDVEEYEYRYKMYDKFVRDVLEMPHEKVIDKLSKMV